jgi:hypothetical protein
VAKINASNLAGQWPENLLVAAALKWLRSAWQMAERWRLNNGSSGVINVSYLNVFRKLWAQQQKHQRAWRGVALP